jgi:hypothetical protein
VNHSRVIAGLVAGAQPRRLRPYTPLLALCVVLSPRPVLGQPPDPSVTPAVVTSFRAGGISTRWDGSVVSPVPLQRGSSRDSLKDGAIVGAAIGTVAFGALAAVLCRAYQEKGGPSCVPDTLRFAAIGGAIGSGIGVVIDAARNQRPGVSVGLAIRF